jgi:zinc protease
MTLIGNRVSLPGTHNITRVVLTNGIVVLVYENYAAQSVVISGSVRAGSVFESPELNGLASLTASSLMRGTQNRAFDTINDALESIGADLDIGGGVHRASFSGKALAEDLPVLIDLLADSLRYPVFPQDEVDRLRGEIVTFLQIRLQDTRYRANRAFYEKLYPPNHPYHYSTRGTLESLPRLTVETLKEFHVAQYGPTDMLIAIVGAVNAADAVDIVRSRFEDWENPAQTEPPAIPSVPAKTQTEKERVRLPGKTQSDIVMGVIGPSRFSADFQAANLANSILGQFGMMGRIGKTVREKLGLAYYAYSALEGGFAPSPWTVMAGVNPSNVDLAVDRITDEVRRLINEAVSDTDLADNKSYFTGRLPLQLETNEGLASSILSMEMYDLGLDYLVNYRDMINALTQADLLAAAQRYLNPDAMVIAVAGPEA